MVAEATRDGLALDAPAPDGPATASRVARFGPTTPTRARRPLRASVDPTDARNDILGCFGRSDRSAPRSYYRRIIYVRPRPFAGPDPGRPGPRDSGQVG